MNLFNYVVVVVDAVDVVRVVVVVGTLDEKLRSFTFLILMWFFWGGGALDEKLRSFTFGF